MTNDLRARLFTVTALVSAALVLAGGLAVARLSSGDRDDDRGSASRSTSTSAAAPVFVGPDYAAAGRLVPLAACPEVEQYVRSNALARVNRYNLPTPSRQFRPRYEEIVRGAPATGDTDLAAPVAELWQRNDGDSAGVASGDGRSTPGPVAVHRGAIFVLAQEVPGIQPVPKLRIFAPGPPPTIIGSIALPGQVHGLLLARDQLFVISEGTDYRAMTISVFDVAHPERVALIRQLDIDAFYGSARLVDDHIVLVTRKLFTVPDDPARRGVLESDATALAKNRAALQHAAIDTWLPHYTMTVGNGAPSAATRLVECEQILRPAAFSGFGLVTVSRIPTSGNAVPHSAAVLTAQQTPAYVSSDRMYLAEAPWGSSPQGGAELLRPTFVHAFDLHTRDLKYRATGGVDGLVQWDSGMNEYRGRLRVVTDDRVAMLREYGTALGTEGQVVTTANPLAQSSVGLLGSFGFTTAETRNGSIAALDLRDPRHPSIGGNLPVTSPGPNPELDIGFVPLGRDRVLLIRADRWQTAKETSELVLLDIRSPSAPVELARFTTSGIVGGNDSAFAYFPKQRILAAPVAVFATAGFQGFSGGGTYYPGGNRYASQILLLRVTGTAVSELGRVDNLRFGSTFDRFLMLKNNLYAVSSSGLRVFQTSPLEQVGALDIDSRH